MNDEEIKVSELDLADEIRDTDQIMIVQGGINKKVIGEKINDRTISDSYGTSEEKGYSQRYQNEHNVIVSPTQPTTSEKVWFKQGKNLFNKNSVLRKTGINSSGNLVQNNNYFTSELIKVNSNTDYYVVGAAVVYGYSNSGSYIGMLKDNLSAGTFNTGEASYIRLRNWWATDDTQMEEQINATMLNIGTTGLPYEEYITPSIIVNDTEFYSQEYINNETTKANGCYQGFSNQAQTISGTTPVTINNMTLTITTTGKPLFIATNFTGRTSNASYTALVKIYIDGVVKVQRLNTIISTTDTPYSGMALINNLEAGVHTIEIKVVGENTNSSISFPTYITRYLSAWEV